jgi:hypothetical protein
MKLKPYKRKQGDFEVRVLADGQLVMIAPDEQLVEIAKMIGTAKTHGSKEIHHNARAKNTENT